MQQPHARTPNPLQCRRHCAVLPPKEAEMSFQLDDDAVLRICSAAAAAQGLFIFLAPFHAYDTYMDPVCAEIAVCS